MRKLADELWVHEDSMRLGAVELGLRATITRLTDRGLWVHSPTQLSESLQAELAQLGEVRHIVGPSNGHNLWLVDWQRAYPQATVSVSAGIPKKLPELGAHEVLQANPWPDDFEHAMMGGVPFFDEHVFLHRKSRSLLVTDFVQDHRKRQSGGFARVMETLLLRPIGFKDICTAPPLRFGFVIKDKPAFRQFVATVRSWEFDRIVVTHGDVIEDAAMATLQTLCTRWEST